MNHKRQVLAAIGIATMVFLGGFYADRFLAPRPQYSDSIGIQGHYVVNAYHRDGTLFASVPGHNALFIDAKNALVACITGTSTTPLGFNRCSPLITAIEICGSPCTSASDVGLPVTNVPTPSGCSVTFDSNNPNTPACTGWTSSATFDTLTDTGLVGATITSAWGTCCTTTASHNDIWDSFTLTSPVGPLSSGDRLIVTITFTIP